MPGQPKTSDGRGARDQNVRAASKEHGDRTASLLLKPSYTNVPKSCKLHRHSIVTINVYNKSNEQHIGLHTQPHARTLRKRGQRMGTVLQCGSPTHPRGPSGDNNRATHMGETAMHRRTLPVPHTRDAHDHAHAPSTQHDRTPKLHHAQNYIRLMASDMAPPMHT